MGKQSLWRYDISYCVNKDCPHEDCRRRQENIPKGYVVSLADQKAMDGENCRNYLKGGKDGKR